jgi:hypothetical protein
VSLSKVTRATRIEGQRKRKKEREKRDRERGGGRNERKRGKTETGEWKRAKKNNERNSQVWTAVRLRADCNDSELKM